MLRLATWIIVGLAIGVLVAPLAETLACDDAHADGCGEDCACACCSQTLFGCHEPARDLLQPYACRLMLLERQCAGTVLAADIFRPPATC